MNPVVKTRSGQVLGSFSNGVYSFKGVPYAAPPFGNRRFRPPQPVEAWSGDDLPVERALEADAHAKGASATIAYEFAWPSRQFNGLLGACHGHEIGLSSTPAARARDRWHRRYLIARSELEHEIAGLMGGRATVSAGVQATSVAAFSSFHDLYQALLPTSA